MEFEAKSARDSAWYDVSTFLSHRSLETSDPEVLVQFAGFGPEEDEWVNIRRHEGKEQALYFDAQRRRHDVRGCRCRFLVRYDHDQAEEIVPLRKICCRPETDCRLQEFHAGSASAKNPQIAATVGTPQKQPKPEDATSASDYRLQEFDAGNAHIAGTIGTPQQQPKPEDPADTGATSAPFPPMDVSVSDESKAPLSIISHTDSRNELAMANSTDINSFY